MIVVAIIGILAAIAIPQFSVYRTRAFNATALSDLHNLMTAEESEYVGTQTYTPVASGIGPFWLFGNTKFVSRQVGFVINTSNLNTEYAAFTGHANGSVLYGSDSSSSAIFKKNDAAPAAAAQSEGATAMSGWGGSPL